MIIIKHTEYIFMAQSVHSYVEQNKIRAVVTAD